MLGTAWHNQCSFTLPQDYYSYHLLLYLFHTFSYYRILQVPPESGKFERPCGLQTCANLMQKMQKTPSRCSTCHACFCQTCGVGFEFSRCSWNNTTSCTAFKQHLCGIRAVLVDRLVCLSVSDGCPWVESMLAGVRAGGHACGSVGAHARGRGVCGRARGRAGR